MHRPGLTLENAPPLSVPMRYFLSAPLFAALAGVMLLWCGPVILTHRWAPALIAATHLVTLGFITMVMLGALSQMIPVLGGSAIAYPRLIAGLVHPLFSIGVLGLVLGLVGVKYVLAIALALLGAAVLIHLAAVVHALGRTVARNASVTAMRLAAFGFLTTVCLGVALGYSRSGVLPLSAHLQFVNAHVLWGLVGWVGLLIVGVAYQVVPMFQITADYPPRLRQLLAPGIFAAIALGSLAQLLQSMPPVHSIAMVLAGLGLAVFAVMTLHLQSQRRRKLADVTLTYWRGAMSLLLIALGVWLGRSLELAPFANPATAVAIGFLILIGVVQSVINGMLYKIVPFIIWLHLQTQGVRWMTMKKILPDRYAQRQSWTHFTALALLLLGFLSPLAFYCGALLYVAANLYLEWNLLIALQTYRRKLHEAALPTTGP